MNRLDDTVEYLNTLELTTGKYKRSAFDFFDFMNNLMPHPFSLMNVVYGIPVELCQLLF